MEKSSISEYGCHAFTVSENAVFQIKIFNKSSIFLGLGKILIQENLSEVLIDLIRVQRVFSLNGIGKKPTRIDHEEVSGSSVSLEAIGLTVIAGEM